MPQNLSLRATIISTMRDVATATQSPLADPLTDETVLLESGMDSLAFAALVAQLEENLGFDPFTLSDLPFYPRTLGEFISFYEKMNPNKA